MQWYHRCFSEQCHGIRCTNRAEGVDNSAKEAFQRDIIGFLGNASPLQTTRQAVLKVELTDLDNKPIPNNQWGAAPIESYTGLNSMDLETRKRDF